jgi:hypothetical protein
LPACKALRHVDLARIEHRKQLMATSLDDAHLALSRAGRLHFIVACKSRTNSNSQRPRGEPKPWRMSGSPPSYTLWADPHFIMDVRYWHKAAMLTALTNVRFEGNHGHDADVTRCLLMTHSGHALIIWVCSPDQPKDWQTRPPASDCNLALGNCRSQTSYRNRGRTHSKG